MLRVIGLIGADAAFAQDNLFVAARHDVFGAHQQLLNGAGQAALEQNGLVDFSERFQQLEVLHIACADLNDIDILKKGQVGNAHDFRDNGKAGLLARLVQKFEPLGFQALEGIGRGAGLEGAAAQKLRAGGFYALGDAADLVVAFHRAGAGDDGKPAVADFLSRGQGDDGIVG